MKRLLPFLLYFVLILGCGSTQVVVSTPEVKTSLPFNPTRTATRSILPTSTPVMGSISYPVPFGVTATISSFGWQDYDFEISVNQIIRGAEAWNLIYRANMFNDEPLEGMEYILIEVSVKNTSSSVTLELNSFDFETVSNAQIFDSWYYNVCCLGDVGKTELDITLLPTGSATGWLALPVFIDDLNPMLIMGRDDDAGGGIYFSLTSNP
jgi:hypothetical protein